MLEHFEKKKERKVNMHEYIKKSQQPVKDNIIIAREF